MEINKLQHNNMPVFRGNEPEIKSDVQIREGSDPEELKQLSDAQTSYGQVLLNKKDKFEFKENLTDEEFKKMLEEVEKDKNFQKIKTFNDQKLNLNKENIQLVKYILNKPELLKNRSIMNHIKNIINHSYYKDKIVTTMSMIDEVDTIQQNQPELWSNVNFSIQIGDILLITTNNEKGKIAKKILNMPAKLWDNQNFAENAVNIIDYSNTDDQIEIANEILKVPTELWENDNFIFSTGTIIDKSETKIKADVAKEILKVPVKLWDSDNFSKSAEKIMRYTDIEDQLSLARKLLSAPDTLLNNEIYINQIGNIIDSAYIKSKVEYVKNIDFENLVKNVPEIGNFSVVNMNAFIDYHYKNGTTEFNDRNLTCPFNLEEKLSSKLVPYPELERVLSIFPKTKREIGTIPDDWGINNDKEKQKQVYDVIKEFTKKNDKSDLEHNLSNILEKKVKIGYINEGCFGKVYKLSIDGCKPYALKTYKETPYLSGDIDGAGIEPANGLFAKNNNVTNFAKFYFGKLSNSNDTDGFMVNEFLDKENPSEQTVHDRLDLILMTSTDKYERNVIGKKFIDYGQSVLYDDVPSLNAYKIATNLVDNTLDFKNNMFVIKQDTEEYLDRLLITPDIQKADITEAINYIKTVAKNCPDKYINILNLWLNNNEDKL